MDLAWDGSFKGRIHILLSPDTPLAKQFRILCTGQLGPTYAHTKFFNYGDLNQYNEFMTGGDYEYNDGSGGKAVVEEIDVHAAIYKREGTAGVVWAPTAGDDGAAQFNINTGSGCNRVLSCIFGEVEDGTDILKDAIKRLQSVTDVEIMDCGLVLPLS